MSLKRYAMEIPEEEYHRIRLHFIAQTAGYKAMGDTWRAQRVNCLIAGDEQGAAEAERRAAECDSLAGSWALTANSIREEGDAT